MPYSHHLNEAQPASRGDQTHHHPRFWDSRAGQSNQLSKHARWQLCFLMNYIDHGVKFLFSIPLTRKRASCIAVALLEIFTAVGPPMILQSDNGNEFNTAAMTRKQVNKFCGKLVRLTDLELSEIITEVRQLWPECQMVRGSPRHSPSNGGVKQVNRTMQEKLGAWMKDCKSRQWTIGCRLMMW